MTTVVGAPLGVVASGFRTTPVGPQLPSAILAASPLGYWKLDEPSGTAAADSSGNARPGVYSASGLTLGGAPGPGGNYVQFGTGDGGVSVVDNDAWSVNATNGLVLFALVKPTSIAGTTQKYIASKGGGGGYEWAMFHSQATAGMGQARLWTSAGNDLQVENVVTNMLTPLGQWNAIAVRWQNTTASSIIKFYKNSGTPLAGTQHGSGSGAYSNGTSKLQIGWRDDLPANNSFDGGMAHVAIFPGTITDGQIDAIMNAAMADTWIPAPPIPLSGLGLWFDADDASKFTYSSGAVVSQWNDSSANGRHMNQGTVASQPIRNGTTNGRTTVVFDGNDCWLARMAAYTINQPFTVFFVADCLTGVAGDETQTFLAAYGGSFQIITQTHLLRLYANTPDLVATHTITGLHLWRAVCNGATSSIHRDGVVSKTGSLGTAGTTTGMMISIERGYGTADAIHGQLAEMILYERVPSAGETTQIENYLRTKWGTP